MNPRLPLTEPQERHVTTILAHLEKAVSDLRNSIGASPPKLALTRYEDALPPTLDKAVAPLICEPGSLSCTDHPRAGTAQHAQFHSPPTPGQPATLEHRCVHAASLLGVKRLWRGRTRHGAVSGRADSRARGAAQGVGAVARGRRITTQEPAERPADSPLTVASLWFNRTAFLIAWRAW